MQCKRTFSYDRTNSMNTIILEKLIVPHLTRLIPVLYGKQKVITIYEVHETSPRVSKMSQTNPVHAHPNNNLKINLIFTLASTPTFSPLSLYLRSPQQ